MDLDFSEEQIMLRESADRLCNEFHTSLSIRELEKSDLGFSQEFWRASANLGLCGLSVGEVYGGTGLGALEIAVFHEEIGRTIVPSPHLDCCVISSELLSEAGSNAQKEKWLSGITRGKNIVIPAWQEAKADTSMSHISTLLTKRGKQRVLSGKKVLVPYANSADAFIVLARDENQEAHLLLIPAENLILQRQANHADQNLFSVTFDHIEVSAVNWLSSNADIAACWDRAMLKGLLATAAQAVGGASRILEMAIDYAKVRQQFGKPIGAFQSIAHYLADRATEIEGARYLTYQAAWACDSGEEWEQLALMAKLHATAVFRRSAVDSVQIHGGMGFSAEADPQLYYRRAKHLQLMHWDPDYLEHRIALKVFG